MINRIRKSFATAVECHHGGRVRQAKTILGAEPLDFSANINPLGSPPLEKLFLEELKGLAHYPDNGYPGFRRAAAKFTDVPDECIVPGNGSSELIRLFSEACLEDGELALVPTPSFGEYSNQSRLAGGIVRMLPIEENGLPAVSDALLKTAKLLFLCNPNNPTGRLLSFDMVQGLVERCEEAGTFLLVDEAFIELSDPKESVASLAPDREYLFVMRSLTKSFGVPGLRLGFGVTNESLARILNLARIPWSIGSIAASAGEYLLGCDGHLRESRVLIGRENAWLHEALKEIGLLPIQSSVNFILVDIRPARIDSDLLALRMMRKGVLVRDCQSFGLGKGFIRVAVRNRDENERLIDALKKAISCSV